ncbi:MAG: formate dehydrogenase accessory sulfurtransferase FdhD [Opitutaceae bacterium]
MNESGTDRGAGEPASTRVSIFRISENGSRQEMEDTVAAEEPLEIRVEGRGVAVVMRTPGHDEELTAGFLLTEGVIRSRADVFEISPCPSVSAGSEGNVIDVLLVHADKADLKRLTRHVFTASSCGICGKGSIEAVHQRFAPLGNTGISTRAAVLARLSDAMAKEQRVFNSTGGLHAAALFDLAGRLLCLREDVGRHNAVDKVLGRALLDGSLPLESHTLFVSGRVSFEIMQKALAARIPIVAGISAPTSLAIEFARESGQTLAGFVRHGSMNLYAGASRIDDGHASPA